MTIEKLMKEMTLEEKIGQLFQVGFVGTKVTPEIETLIKDYHVGGVIYFRRNLQSLEQVTALSNQLQRIAFEKERGIPLIISADQEGGIVTRLSGGTHFPGNMALGATGDIDLAMTTGGAVAKELSGVGINMNLAPVLDVNNNPDNPIIGVRSFGEDPEKVAQLGKAFIQGMQKQGVIACGKHFPGHGDTDTDSHLDLPIIKHEQKRLEKIEFHPFKVAIKAGVDSLMTAHVYFPAIESNDGIPATLSHAVLSKLLREELGYQGLIITDCMEMDAIVNSFGTVQGSLMTLQAGTDMVLISHTLQKQKEAIELVINAVKRGQIPEERIEQSVYRILSLKDKRIGLNQLPVADWRRIDKLASESIAHQIAENAVTLVKDEATLLPLSPEEKILLIDFEMNGLRIVEDKGRVKSPLVELLNENGIKVHHHIYSQDRSELPILDAFDKVIVCTYSVLLNPEQGELVRQLLEMVPVIVVALRNPYDLKEFPNVNTFLTTYDYSKANLTVAAEIMVGKRISKGILPITL